MGPETLVAAALPGQASGLKLKQLEATVWFPRQPAGQPLKQRAILHLDNPGAPVDAVATITVGDNTPYREDLGTIAAGKSAIPPDPGYCRNVQSKRCRPRQELLRITRRSQEMELAARKKWKLYSVSYSHHDLGYGNYPHRLRTDIRHANIEFPLKFCKQTDGWDEDSKFRFMIETAEPITSFLGSHSEADAIELGRRVREGRIQIGGLHSTVSTEQMSEELMARLFYLGVRHSPDLLGAPPGKTAQIGCNVIGLTWPLATYIKDAGLSYLFHGHDGYCDEHAPGEL